tara:strand:- start:334 stop:462 length:129 start_codon:yes stop_codon:yes gene_type:complete
MIELLPYYALFYIVGLLLMGLFVRLFLYKRRMKKYKKNDDEN